jgi:glucose-1-phosphate thymidylyltransferase
MRRRDGDSRLSERQEAAAELGLKAMMPLEAGSVFLDYVVSALADAGITDVCLVVGPDHEAIREHYARQSLSRVRVEFAIQAEPIGTANAVLSAREFAGEERFLVLNSDNYYSVEAYRALADGEGSGLIGFDRETLIRESNIEAGRVARYALLDVSEGGWLRRIVEKPDEATYRAMSGATMVSMNLWVFTSGIFEACRTVPKSARGEYELPHAVQHGIDALGMRVRVVPMSAGVLDMSSRSDVATVASRLARVEVRL